MLKRFLSNPAVVSILNGQLRHLGTAAGAALATDGFIEGSDVSAVSGIIVTAGMMVLSYLAKRV